MFITGQIVFSSEVPATKSADRGFTPGKSYTISDVENISRQSGNLMMKIPLGSLPTGRGGLSGGIGLQYNSKLWDMSTVEVERGELPQDGYTINSLIKSKEGGWKYGYQYYLKTEHAVGVSCQESHFLEKIQMVLPDGGQHTMFVESGGITGWDDYSNVFPDGTDACGGPPITPGQTISLFSTDGTFLRLEVITDSDADYRNNQWTLYLPDGKRIQNKPVSGVSQRIVDRNGNRLDIIENISDSAYSGHRTTYLVDDLGRKVIIEYSAVVDEINNTAEDYIHSKGVNGVNVTTRVKWKNIRVNKVYNACSQGGCEPPMDHLYNVPLDETFRIVEKISLPSQISGNLNYAFDYNADSTSSADTGWGELKKITLPSGAKSSYEYLYDNNTNSTPTDEVLKNSPVKKTLTYNLEYDGQVTPTSEVWLYERADSYPNDYSKITMPDGGINVEHYSLTEGPSTFPNAPEYIKGETYKIENQDGSTIENIYQSNIPAQTNPVGYPNLLFKANRYIKYEFTSIKNAAGNLTLTAINEYWRDKNGNVTEVRQYDFVPYSSVPRASGKPTGLPSNASAYLKRITRTAYYNDTPDASSTNYTDTDSYHLSSNKRLLNLVKSTEVQSNNGTPQSRSEIYYDFTDYGGTNTKGGNAIETRSWDSTKQAMLQSADSNGYKLVSSNYINLLVLYDSYANPIQTTDAKGVQSTVTYGSVTTPSGIVTGLYPTQTETASNNSAVRRTTTATYDFYTGLITSTTDVDNNLTSATEFDDLGRPTKEITAVGTPLEVWTQTVYDDAGRKVIAKSDIETKGDARKVSAQFYDQLGRVRLTKTLENSATQSAINETDGIKVQTRYLTIGNYTYQLASNPYRAATSAAATAESEMGWTRSMTVNNGKHSETETFSGALLPYPFLTTGYNTNSTGKVQTDIDADRTMVTEQSGKRRISKTNALGQLENVWEITAADSNTESITFGNLSLNGYKTIYSYDPLNNLTTVNQGAQTRTFTYSSLSRLKSANNPESGLTQYQYDANGNLTTKTDGRSITTSYFYDALNRVTQRSYSGETGYATPAAFYFYDNLPNAKGKLIKVSNSISATEYSNFDILGRALTHKQMTDGQTYSTTYAYNLSGTLTEQTYPSGRVVRNIFDANGNLSEVESKKNSSEVFRNYATNFVYTASGAISSLKLGNGRFENTVYNSRLQPIQIGLGSSATNQNLLKLNFDYGTTDNNGNIKSQTITVPTVGSNQGFTALQTYSYDSLSRIKQAQETIDNNQTPNWKQTFSYDRFGNRRFDEANTTTLAQNCPTAVCNPTVDLATNKLIGYQFDNAGNTKVDAENRTFIYDGENKQVEVKDSYGNSIGRYFYDGDGKRVKKISLTETTLFIYDKQGLLIAECSTQLSQTSNISFMTADHLNSPRINTNSLGQVISRHDYQPFGEEIARTNYGWDSVRKKFTSYERDTETNLDYAQSRYFNSGFGRFSSPDSFTNDTHVSNPQSWNLYSYVRNNPLVMVDPLGKKGTISWYTDQNGVVQVKLAASFAIYGANGQKVTGEDLAAAKKAFIAGAQKYLSENFKVEGKSFQLSTDITADVYDSESDAIKSGSDNIVEVGYEDLVSKREGDAAGLGFGVKGESFDRMVIQIAEGLGNESGFNYQRADEFGETFAHEFGAHLLAAKHNVNRAESLSLFSKDGGDGRLYESDFVRLFVGGSGLKPPPPRQGENQISTFRNFGLMQGAQSRLANSRDNESPTAVYEWRKRVK